MDSYIERVKVFRKFILRIISTNNNQYFYNVITMNVPTLLYSTRDKQSPSILPHPSIYILPTHKWVFCHQSLITLAKNKANTSLSAFFMQSQTNFRNTPTIMSLFESHNYLSSRFQHIVNHLQQVSKSSSFVCYCLEDMSCPVTHKLNCHQQIKQKIGCQDQNLNLSQLTKKIFGFECHKDDKLTFIKMPSPLLFSVSWSNNYAIFNNKKDEGEIKINMHIKNKIIQTCLFIKQKLQVYFTSQFQSIIRNLQQALAIPKIQSFKLWFYLNEKNNQAYCVLVSDIKLEQVSCKIYPNFNPYIENLQQKQQKEKKDQKQLRQDLQCHTCYCLITGDDLRYELTNNHTQQIQYLRQVKMIKPPKVLNQYDFIIVCSKCYEAFVLSRQKIKSTYNPPKFVAKKTQRNGSDLTLDFMIPKKPKVRIESTKRHRILTSNTSNTDKTNIIERRVILINDEQTEIKKLKRSLTITNSEDRILKLERNKSQKEKKVINSKKIPSLSTNSQDDTIKTRAISENRKENESYQNPPIEKKNQLKTWMKQVLREYQGMSGRIRKERGYLRDCE